VKVIEREILPFQESDFFAPIRDKVAFARLIVCAARHLLSDNPEQGTAKMKLIVDKMSRLFFYSKDKYFSVAFPLTVFTDDEIKGTGIKTYSGKILDYQNISGMIAILDDPCFTNSPSLLEYTIQPEGIEEKGIHLLEEIMQFEPSYIRYDHDSKNQNGKLHPLHHLDVNYSPSGTYKLGLERTLRREGFEDLQNTTTKCFFVVDE
jgi:hypothetical protein